MKFLVILSILNFVGSKESHPSVDTLLKSSAEMDVGRKSAFFEALTSLLREQGLEPDDYLIYRGSGSYSPLISGSSFPLGNYVILVLSGLGETSIPGESLRQLILVGRDGRILDKMACDISSRSGYLYTKIATPKHDTHHLSVHLKPSWPFDENGHPDAWFLYFEVTFRGKIYQFEKNLHPWEVWERRGLCQVVIEEDRFTMMFPSLNKAVHMRPESEPYFTRKRSKMPQEKKLP